MSQVLVYTRTERLWHWLQAFLFVLLLLTGFEIHSPEIVRIVGFERAVRMHEMLGLLVVATAILSVGCNLTIRPLAPQSRDFVSLGWAQIRHFRPGASAEASHPLQRRPEPRLRGIEQLTYFVILNVLIPVQVGTGLLMWRASSWASWVERLGGMRVIASVHALAAWLFVTSILVHVYLTMLGRTPLGRIRAMILGREEQPEVMPKTAAGADQNPRLGAAASAGSPVINRTS